MYHVSIYLYTKLKVLTLKEIAHFYHILSVSYVFYMEPDSVQQRGFKLTGLKNVYCCEGNAYISL